MSALLLLLGLMKGHAVHSALVYETSEGQDLTLECPSHVSGGITIFCRNKCEEPEDKLVKTSGGLKTLRHSSRYRYTCLEAPSGKYKLPWM